MATRILPQESFTIAILRMFLRGGSIYVITIYLTDLLF